jgi:periplasmic protein TonB
MFLSLISASYVSLPMEYCRNIGAGRLFGAMEIIRNNSGGVGVYIDVFEQSILIDNRPNKSWSLLASLSAELLVVSVLILVPLIYGDHLPDFHWHVVTVGPPVRRIETPPAQARAANGPTRPEFHHPALIPNPIQATQLTPVASGPVTIEQPPGIQLGGDGAAPGPALFGSSINIAAPPPKPAPLVKPSAPIHVSGGVQMAKLVKQVIPVYPPMARSARISGVVHLVGIIAKDGSIRNLQLIAGHPLLSRAALDAVSQWIYKPTLLSGEPVEVICPIDVTFTLGQ